MILQQIPSLEPMTQGSDDLGLVGYIIAAGVLVFAIVLFWKMAVGLSNTDNDPKEGD